MAASIRVRRGHVSAAYAFPDDVTNMTGTTRVETDLLGSMIIPADALYGIATARAMDNYDDPAVEGASRGGDGATCGPRSLPAG